MLQIFRAAPWLLLDRVPLIDHPTDLFCVQVVPASYFDARLPMVIFSARTWLLFLNSLGFHQRILWKVPEDCLRIFDLVTGEYRWELNTNHGVLLKNATSPSLFV